jgi:hypothetical protein
MTDHAPVYVRTCKRHGSSPHSSYDRCLTCALEEIAITHGGKARDFYLKPNPETTPASLIRSRARYQRLKEERERAEIDIHIFNTLRKYLKKSAHYSTPGSTARQQQAASIYRECGSQSETARRMGISRAAAHGLLQRAGII